MIRQGSDISQSPFSPRWFASKSEPSLLTFTRQESNISHLSQHQVIISRQHSEPNLSHGSHRYSPVQPVRTLSFPYLGRKWSLTFHRTGGKILDYDYLRLQYNFNKPSDLCFINVADKKLVYVEKAHMSEFSNVIFIDAGDNSLQLEGFSNFRNLKELLLPLNNISYFGLYPQQLDSLQILDLSFNSLVPTVFHILSFLPHLKLLNVTANNLDRLPSGLNNKSFPSLEMLILDDNKLRENTNILYLSRLPKLKLLSLDNNRIASIPFIDSVETGQASEELLLSIDEQHMLSVAAQFCKKNLKECCSKFYHNQMNTNLPVEVEGRLLNELCHKHLQEMSTTLARKRRSRLTGSLLLLRHLDKSHMNGGTWPLPPKLLSALMAGVPVAEVRRSVPYEPNAFLLQHLKQVYTSNHDEVPTKDGALGIEMEDDRRTPKNNIRTDRSSSTVPSVSSSASGHKSQSASSPSVDSSFQSSNEKKTAPSINTDSLYEPVADVMSDVSASKSSSSKSKSLRSMISAKSDISIRRKTTNGATSDIHETRSDTSKLSRQTAKFGFPVREKEETNLLRLNEGVGASVVHEGSGSVSNLLTKALPEVLPPDEKAEVEKRTSPLRLATGAKKCQHKKVSPVLPAYFFDTSNALSPFSHLEQLSLVGNKIADAKGILALKMWPLLKEVAISGNPVSASPPGHLYQVKHLLLPFVEKKLMTYKVIDPGKDPFYRNQPLSKYVPLEKTFCACHTAKAGSDWHTFFNLDITSPSPPGMASLPLPTLRMCRYQQSVQEAISAYHALFQDVPLKEENLPPLPPLNIRATLFPMKPKPRPSLYRLPEISTLQLAHVRGQLSRSRGVQDSAECIRRGSSDRFSEEGMFIKPTRAYVFLTSPNQAVKEDSLLKGTKAKQ